MPDLGTKREVVNQSIDPFPHRWVLSHLDNFKLLGPHQSIGNFFDCLKRKAATADIKFPNIFKIRKNFSNSLCIVHTENDVAKL